jgi:enterochelin esterase-like enzyme
MGLTSGLFLGLVIVAVIVLPLATILLWSRLRGPNPLRIAQRLVLIVLCQGTAVLLAALMINNSFQLYTSWSDLLGNNGSSGQIEAGNPLVASATGAAAPGKGADRNLPNAALFQPDRALQGELHVVITGPISRVTADIVVWLPPEYYEKQYQHTEFPVIQLLSGYPGSVGSWFKTLAAPNMLENEVRNHNAKPAILIGATINVDGSHNPDCSNIPGGPQVATWLARDVRNLIEGAFRTSTDRGGWGLMGYSEGGLCASKLILQYPGDYIAAVSMSGDDHPDGDLLKPGTAAYYENSPLWLLQHRPPAAVSLLLTGTLQDGSTAAEADEMSRAAKPPTVVSRLISERGGHNVGVWRAAEPAALDWLSKQFGGAQVNGLPAAPPTPSAADKVAAGPPYGPFTHG